MSHNQWFLAFLVIALAFVAAAFAYLHLKQRRVGPQFPRWESVQIKFHASGVSGRNLRSRIGRGPIFRSVLSVTVTPDELWIRTYFPFSGLALLFDAEHRIVLESIQDLDLQGRRLFIYVKDVHSEYEIELMLRNSEQLYQHLSSKH